MNQVKNTQADSPSSKPRHKKSLLTLVIMTAMTPAFAANNPKPSDMVEEVVVQGTRASLLNAQDMKRSSDTVMDAISASDIGSLPDKSVLESLQRVPGISIERYAAAGDPDHFSIEGSAITLRGLSQTRSEFNGRDSFSANSGRGLSFQDVPPELMSKVEVFKNQTADMIEGGIAGTVNLVTRKPFDSKNRIVAFTAAADYADLSEETEPSISGLYSDTWETNSGEFGFLISLSDSKLTTQTDGYGIGVHTLTNIAGTGARWVPHNAALRTTTQERERKGASLVGQWQDLEGNWASTIEYVRSDASLVWNEHVMDEYTFAGTPSSDSVYNDLSFISGTLNNVDPYLVSTRRNDKNSLVEDFSLNLAYTPSDELSITADAQYTKGSTKVVDLSIFGGVKASTFIDMSSDTPDVVMLAPTTSTQTGAEYFADPANYFYRSAMDHLEDSEGDETALKLDLKYELNAGILSSVETGLRLAQREQITRWSKYNWGESSNYKGGNFFYFNGNTTTTNPSSQYNAPASEAYAFDSFFGRNKEVITGGKILVPSESIVANYDSFLAATDTFGFINAAARGDGSSLYLPSEINDTTEQNTAIYGKLNFASSNENLTGNIGVRLVEVNTEANSGGTLYATALTGMSADDRAFSSGKDEASDALDNSVTAALPSLNINYQFTPELIGRFAASKAISFADMGNMRNYTTLYAVQKVENNQPGFEYRAYAGNTHLEPTEATNLDVSVEWYFAEVGSVSAGLFYKDISNLITNGTALTEFTHAGVTRNVRVEKPINNGSAEVSGIELAYSQFFDKLPAPFDGLGLQANLTLLDQSNDATNSNLDSSTPPRGEANLLPIGEFSNLPLQGLSDTTYNLVAMYEKGAVSARIAYNWRSEYLLTTRDVITKLPVYSQAMGQVDASFMYAVTDYLKMGFEGANLLNEVTWTKVQVNDDGDKLNRNYFVNDRRISFIVKSVF